MFPKKHKCVIPFPAGRVWSGWWGIAAGCHGAPFDLDKWPLSGPLCFQRPPHWVLSLLGRNQSPTSCAQRCPGTRAREGCPREHTCPNDGHFTAILDAQKLSVMEPQWKFSTMSLCDCIQHACQLKKERNALVKQSLPPLLCQAPLPVSQWYAMPVCYYYAVAAGNIVSFIHFL